MVNYPAVASGHGEALPPDVLFDVMLRLPANDICRFRAVCRHWRSLTSDRLFTEAHAARHPGPLIVASRAGDGEGVHLMDLSGYIVKRLPVPEGLTTLVRSRLGDLVCVANNSDGRCAVINPVTGAVSHFPAPPPEENGDCTYHVFLLGRVESTGECKVLRLSRDESFGRHLMSSSVLTLENDDDAGRGGARWRPSGRPEFLVNTYSGVVVGGAAYFFWWAAHYPDQHHRNQLRHDGVVPDCVARFDLETEAWSTIRGPRLVDDAEYISSSHVWKEYMSMLSTSTLAELKGHLVLVHNFGCLDLWFLTDTENHLWAKEYSISYPDSVILSFTRLVKPLLLLDDGRIIIFLGHWGTLYLYDPANANDAFSRLDTWRLDEVGLYTGSLLG